MIGTFERAETQPFGQIVGVDAVAFVCQLALAAHVAHDHLLGVGLQHVVQPLRLRAPFLSFGLWRFQTYRKGRAFNMRQADEGTRTYLRYDDVTKVITIVGDDSKYDAILWPAFG